MKAILNTEAGQELVNILNVSYSQVLTNKDVPMYVNDSWLNIIRGMKNLWQIFTLMFELYSDKNDSLHTFALKVINK